MRFLYIKLVLLTTIFSLKLVAQEKQYAALDPSIVHGQLENGFQYFIKNIPDSKKLELRLYVKVGRNQQTEEEFQFVHFVEHMAFKPSTNLQDGINQYLENNKELNLPKFAVNAHPYLNYTEYILYGNADDMNSIDTGLLWFSDIVDEVSFIDKEVHSEKGVLIQEFIMGSGDNLTQNFNDNLLSGVLYPCQEDHSNFINKMNNIKPDKLRGFYERHYQPESMAVVIIGKIPDVKDVEKKIRLKFADKTNNNRKILHLNCDSIFKHREPQFKILQQLPDTRSDQNLEMKVLYRNVIPDKELNRIELDLHMELLLKTLNKRLDESTRFYNSKYNIMANRPENSDRFPSALEFSLSVRDSMEIVPFRSLSKTLGQLVRFGITDVEFRDLQKSYSEMLENTDTTGNNYWLRNIASFYSDQKPFPEDKLKIERRLLQNLTVIKFNQFLQTLNLEEPEDIGIAVPSNYPEIDIREEDVRYEMLRSFRNTKNSYKKLITPTRLMTEEALIELNEKAMTELEPKVQNVREFQLANGIKLVLKDFTPTLGSYQNKIMIHGFKNYGAANLNPENFYSAVSAPGLVKNSGVGNLNKFEFQDFIQTNSLWWNGIKLYIDPLESGLQIDSAPEDIEQMLQVIYLLLSKPSRLEPAYEDWKTNERRLLENLTTNRNDTRMRNAIRKILGDYTAGSSSLDRLNNLDKVDVNEAYTAYNNILANADGYTFIVSGNFSIDENLKLFNKYLGNIPIKEKRADYKFILPHPVMPEGPVEINLPYFTDGTNNSHYAAKFVAPANKQDWKEHLRVEALGNVLYNQIFGLRFIKNLPVYNVSAGSDYNPITNQYTFGPYLDIVPELLMPIRKEFLEIISKLESDLLSDEIIEQSLKRMKMLNDKLQRGGSNRLISEKLYEFYRFDMPYVESDESLQFINSLTPEDIRATARKYFKDKSLIEFLMINEDSL